MKQPHPMHCSGPEASKIGLIGPIAPVSCRQTSSGENDGSGSSSQSSRLPSARNIEPPLPALPPRWVQAEAEAAAAALEDEPSLLDIPASPALSTCSHQRGCHRRPAAASHWSLLWQPGGMALADTGADADADAGASGASATSWEGREAQEEDDGSTCSSSMLDEGDSDDDSAAVAAAAAATTAQRCQLPWQPSVAAAEDCFGQPTLDTQLARLQTQLSQVQAWLDAAEAENARLRGVAEAAPRRRPGQAQTGAQAWAQAAAGTGVECGGGGHIAPLTTRRQPCKRAAAAQELQLAAKKHR